VSLGMTTSPFCKVLQANSLYGWGADKHPRWRVRQISAAGILERYDPIRTVRMFVSIMPNVLPSTTG